MLSITVAPVPFDLFRLQPLNFNQVVSVSAVINHLLSSAAPPDEFIQSITPIDKMMNELPSVYIL